MTKWKERRICLCFLLPFHCVLLGPYTNSFPSESGLSLWTAGCALLFLLQKQSRKTSWTNSDSFLFGEQEIEFLIISRLRERLQVPLGNKRKEKNLKWLGAKKWPQTFWIWCQMRPRSRRMKTLPVKAMMEASGIGEIQNKVRHGSRLQVSSQFQIKIKSRNVNNQSLQIFFQKAAPKKFKMYENGTKSGGFHKSTNHVDGKFWPPPLSPHCRKTWFFSQPSLENHGSAIVTFMISAARW